LAKQVKRDRTYKNTNELVKRIFNHKKDLNDRIQSRAIDAFKALDPANRSKSGEEPTAKRDLSLIFQGQQVKDPLKNYRL
jgi:nucleosome binding factor SPN SPT16 subunit